MSRTSTHLSDGALRRLLDEPSGVADADRRHAADCTACLTVLTAVRDDAARLQAVLRTDVDVDVDAAWQRLQTALPADVANTPPAPVRRSRRAGELLRRPAAAALAVGLVLTGAGTAAANDWLQVFRSEQVAPVAISPGDLVALPDLSAYGALEVSGDPALRQVDGAAAAAAQTGLDVPEVDDLPRGVTGSPAVQVGDRMTATFTFDADRAARAAQGQALPPPPPGVDGSAVRLVAGPGVAQVWSSSAGLPALVVGRAVAPTAFSSGVAFPVVRDHLLSLPGLPRDVADQLRTFAADGATLPLPFPADEVVTSTEQVDGATATVLRTRDRALSAVVWVDDGVLTVVAGSLDTDEVLDVARGLS